MCEDAYEDAYDDYDIIIDCETIKKFVSKSILKPSDFFVGVFNFDNYQDIESGLCKVSEIAKPQDVKKETKKNKFFHKAREIDKAPITFISDYICIV